LVRLFRFIGWLLKKILPGCSTSALAKFLNEGLREKCNSRSEYRPTDIFPSEKPPDTRIGPSNEIVDPSVSGVRKIEQEIIKYFCIYILTEKAIEIAIIGN
jgi:hypothetical protein